MVCPAWVPCALEKDCPENPVFGRESAARRLEPRSAPEKCQARRHILLQRQDEQRTAAAFGPSPGGCRIRADEFPRSHRSDVRG
jgi:hypothetical protein